jgi:hypothetical protein
MAEIDYSLIPKQDLEILATGTFEGVSRETLQYMSGEGGSSWDAFSSNAERGLTSSLRGLGILQPDEAADLQSEQESRMLLETNPYAGWAGLLIGSALDPVTLPAAILKPLAIGGKVLQVLFVAPLVVRLVASLTLCMKTWGIVVSLTWLVVLSLAVLSVV